MQLHWHLRIKPRFFNNAKYFDKITYIWLVLEKEFNCVTHDAPEDVFLFAMLGNRAPKSHEM